VKGRKREKEPVLTMVRFQQSTRKEGVKKRKRRGSHPKTTTKERSDVDGSNWGQHGETRKKKGKERDMRRNGKGKRQFIHPVERERDIVSVNLFSEKRRRGERGGEC